MDIILRVSRAFLCWKKNVCILVYINAWLFVVLHIIWFCEGNVYYSVDLVVKVIKSYSFQKSKRSTRNEWKHYMAGIQLRHQEIHEVDGGWAYYITRSVWSKGKVLVGTRTPIARVLYRDIRQYEREFCWSSVLCSATECLHKEHCFWL